MKTLATPGTKRWEKELIKALNTPGFTVTRSKDCNDLKTTHIYRNRRKERLDSSGRTLKAQEFLNTLNLPLKESRN